VTPGVTNAAHEWIIERHEAFAFRGASGNPAIAALAIVTRDGSVPVVVATERDDNPGVSVTNGAEQLAAHVLIRLFRSESAKTSHFGLSNIIARGHSTRPCRKCDSRIFACVMTVWRRASVTCWSGVISMRA
jgi:hypothetical protein